jgi:hypothetical protein
LSRETNPDRDDLSVRCPRGRALIRLDDGGDDEEWCNVLCKYERWRGRSEKIVRLRALRSYNLISNLCDANKSQARQTCIPLPPDYVNISVHFPDRREVTPASVFLHPQRTTTFSMDSNIAVLTQSHRAVAAKKREKRNQIKEIVFDEDARRYA